MAFWASSNDGSSWYRVDQPAIALRWLGHRVWASEVLPESAIFSDVLVGSRVANDVPSHRWEALTDSGNRPLLVMDFDDDYWHISPDNVQAYAFWNQPGKLDKLSRNTGLADRVTCVSSGLASVLRNYNDDVRVVPNGLHAALLSAPRTYTSGKVRVGWAGTASTITELHLAARAMNRVVDYTSQGTAEVDTVYIGAKAEGLAQAGIVPHPRAKAVEWITGTGQYLKAVSGFDIWVAPYRSTPFNEAKFATKALEAGFLGIPLIASDIAPYREWIVHGVTGFLVRDSHEWGCYLKRLIDDPGLRASMGHAARDRASSHILQDVARTWEAALTR